MWEIEKILSGRCEAALRVPLRAVGPGEFRVFATTGATCTAAATTRASRTSFATRSPPARSTRSPTRNPASSARSRSPTGGSLVLNYTARVSFRRSSSRAHRRRQRDQVPRRRARDEVSGGQDLAGAASEHGRRRKADRPEEARTCRCATLELANAYPVLQGYKNSAGHRLSRSTSKIHSSSRSLGIHRRVHAGQATLPERASAAT